MFGEVGGDFIQRVLLSGTFIFAQAVQTLVYVDHEMVEVDAGFLLEGQAVKEQVHQPGFAATDIAPEINAVGFGFCLQADFGE